MPRSPSAHAMRLSSPRCSPSWPAGLTGSQKQILTGSLAAFAGHPAYDTATLCADLHRFAFFLGESDGEELFSQPTP
jgi:hypothetical protein